MIRQLVSAPVDPRSAPIDALAKIMLLPPAGDAEAVAEARLLAELDAKTNGAADASG